MQRLRTRLGRRAATRRGTRTLEVGQAYYDADSSIVLVVGEEEFAPSVAVDHEMTHVVLLRYSGLGLLEQLCSFVRWLGRASAEPWADAVEESVEAVLATTRRMSEPVHEAVAWLGTEIHTRGEEDLVAPERHRRDVGRLWESFAGMAGAPAESEQLQPYLHVAEAIGMQALSPSALRPLFDGGLFSAARPEEELRRRLSSAADEPIRRFRRLAAQLRGVEFAEASAWADGVFAAARGQEAETGPAAAVESRLAETQVVPRAELEPRAEALAAAALARVPAATSLDPGELHGRWEWFRTFFTFMLAVDRYAQTSVVPAPRSRPAVVYEGDTAPLEFTLAYALVVSRAASHDEPYGWTKPRTDDGVTVFGAFDDPDQRVVWVTNRAAARHFLAGMAGAKHLVVSEPDYDYAASDFRGSPLVGDLPHVVVRLGDFRSFWLGRAFFHDEGLGGSREIDWMPATFPGDPSSYYGLLVLRGAGTRWPVVLNPCVIGQYERIVSIADEFPSPWGVRLARIVSDPFEWLQNMATPVLAAGRTFADACRRPRDAE